MNTVLRAIIRGVVWRLLPRNSKSTLLALGIVAVIVLMLANGARAATYETACPTGGDPPVQTDPICERLTALVAAVEALPQTNATAVDATVTNWPAASTTEVAGVVSLSEDDATRLDLTWIALWLLAGMTFGFYVATRLWGELKRWFGFDE